MENIEKIQKLIDKIDNSENVLYCHQVKRESVFIEYFCLYGYIIDGYFLTVLGIFPIVELPEIRIVEDKKIDHHSFKEILKLELQKDIEKIIISEFIEKDYLDVAKKLDLLINNPIE